MTREHFTRLFRKRHPLGPAAYLRDIRLKEARRLRKAGTWSLGQLALHTGFSSAQQLDRHL